MARTSRKIAAVVVLLTIVLFVGSFYTVLLKDGNHRMTSHVELPQRQLVDQGNGEHLVNSSVVMSQLRNKEVFQNGNVGPNFTKQDLTLKTASEKIRHKGTQTDISDQIEILNIPSLDKEEKNNESAIRVDVTKNQPITSEEYQWEEEQARRKATLNNECARHPTWNMSVETLSRNPDLLWPLIYDDKYKIIYCSICKVASTTWKSVFLVLMGMYNSVQEVDLKKWHLITPKLHNLKQLNNPAEIEKRLRTYKKFIFVREPFSRELSGYRNKLFKRNPYFQTRVGTKIIKEFRENPDRYALRTGVGVTFTEFVKHLTKSPPESLNGHWRPMYQMVLPCAVDYDYIGHLETTEVDTQNILQKTGLNKVIEIPHITTNLSNSDDIFNRFYQELDPSLLQDMYNTFKFDSELFGYELPELIAKKLAELS